MTGLAVAVLVAACGSDSTGSGGGSGGPIDFGSSVVVSGTVLDSQGVEVFGASIRITIEEWRAEGGCSGSTVEPIGSTERTVNEAGEYSLTILFERDEFDACIWVDAIPPAGSSFEAETQFFSDVDVNEPGDAIRSIRADFVLEP